MQEKALPPDPGFVVEWQLDDEGPVIDLSMAESNLNLPEEPAVDGQRHKRNLKTEV